MLDIAVNARKNTKYILTLEQVFSIIYIVFFIGQKGRNLYMNKTELVAAMADQTGLTKKDAEAALKAFTDIVSGELKNGGDVALVGFGTFKVSERAARTGRNPLTGEEIQIAASKVPSFKAGKALKDQVNA